ncbi:hypothetical protein [Anaerosinus massiliensis]|uniref:hypothetical protein n=1 Tax=Massilibacillus massiliensis TaxID=1806837 RepID=UPI000DA615F9|nr:hypothetical protein [Massilibacillus massiliensis]
MKAFFKNIFSKMNVKHIILSSIFYLIAMLFSKFVFSFILNAGVQIAVFLPPVLGILWGPIAATGIAISSFVGNLVLGDDLYIAITSAIANFFYAFIPYKLWHTIKVRPEDRYLISDIKSLFKFVYIVFLSVFTVSSFFAMITGSSGVGVNSRDFLLCFLYNFDIAVILGSLIFLIASQANVKIYIPEGDKKKLGSAGYYDILLYCVICIGNGYIAFSETSNPNIAFSLWMIMFVLLTLFTQKPIVIRQSSVKLNSTLVKFPIKTKVVYRFLIFSFIMFVYVGGVIYGAFINHLIADTALAWHYFIVSMIVTVHLFSFSAFAILWQLEKHISKPLNILTSAVEEVSADVQQELEREQLQKKLEFHTGDEFELLSDSLKVLLQSVREEKDKLMREQILHNENKQDGAR